MTGETCHHCGGRIEYVDGYDVLAGEVVDVSWWRHVGMATGVTTWDHWAAPAFGGGS